jgi:aspartate aminotransferase
MVILTGGTPIILKTTLQNNFKLTMDDLRPLLNDQTRLLMLNSPSNPTGFAYSEKQYQKIGEVLKDFPNVLIASDEIYEHIYWGEEKYYSFAQACPDLFNRTITINGVSKAYAMTGWRIGYCGGPVEIIRAMKKIQGQSTSNASSISQAATISALNGSLDCVVSMVGEYKNRYHYLFNTLNEISGFKLKESSGAFYAFPEVLGAINRLDLSDDIEFSKYLLEKAQVAVIPGSAFGAPGHIRISFATSIELLEEAMDRIKRVVE